MLTSERKTTIFSILVTLAIVGVLCGFPAYSYAEENAVVDAVEVVSETPEVEVSDSPSDAPEEVIVEEPIAPAVEVADVVTEESTDSVPESTDQTTPSEGSDSDVVTTPEPLPPVVVDDTADADIVVIDADKTADETTPEIDSQDLTQTPTLDALEPSEADEDEVVSDETSFETLTEDGPVDPDTSGDEAVSLENDFDLETPVSLDEAVSIEQNFTTESEGTTTLDETISPEQVFNLSPEVVVDEAISSENDFVTDTTTANADEAVSGENEFTTNSDGNPNDIDEAISPEQNFITLGTTTLDETISPEQNFTTNTGGCGNNCPTVDEAISGENQFTTDFPSSIDEVISPEQSFTTETGGCGNNCPNIDEAISPEQNFTTNTGGCGNNCPTVDEVVSGENQFTTESDSGCTSNCGGGGGGGGGGRGGSRTILPPQCTLYLKTYMRQGYNNNAEEVRKLQIFLRVFEGFDIPVTGVYDQVTENAVRSFQNRYADDILDPWGIGEDTGYAYITTTLKVNYLYCGITTPITLDLRQRFPGLEIGPGGLDELEELINTGAIFATTTATTTLPDQDTLGVNNIFQAAAAGLLDMFNFLWAHICTLAWILILILLAIIAWLLYRLRELKKEIIALKQTMNGGEAMLPAAGAVGLVTLEALADGRDTTTTLDDHWDEYVEIDEPTLLDDVVDPVVAPLPIDESPEAEFGVEEIVEVTPESSEQKEV